MKKTYVTSMPDHVGAFLKASQAIASLQLNITRVSYNKAVDMHTLFIEAEGTPEQLEQATEALQKIGYLTSSGREGAVLLVEFKLRDIPGSVTAILELIRRYDFNISYMSSQENGTEYQLFKMGLLIENRDRFSRFMEEASGICAVRVVDYDKIERIFDNSIFYISFANELSSRMGLSEEERRELVIQSNLVMQILDEHGGSPQKTFSFIGQFGEYISRYKGDRFVPRITRHKLDEEVMITLIEPPCGSNTAILSAGEQHLFIDTGYACYREEMLDYFRALIPDFDTCRKEALLTHADVDHCGLLSLFPIVHLSQKSYLSLAAEYQNGSGFREKNPLHAPYIRICKLLSGYAPPPPEILKVINGTTESPVHTPLMHCGNFFFAHLNFEVYEGQGGHLPGELVLVERQLRLVFTGDILINPKGSTREQAAYNRYAPYLMTSVDTDPDLAARERDALREILAPGDWQIFGGHGLNRILTIPQPTHDTSR